MWRPINTAPKDGTRILIWTVADPILPKYPNGIRLWQIAEWDDDEGDWAREWVGEPRAWQPLPPPPDLG